MYGIKPNSTDQGRSGYGRGHYVDRCMESGLFRQTRGGQVGRGVGQGDRCVESNPFRQTSGGQVECIISSNSFKIIAYD